MGILILLAWIFAAVLGYTIGSSKNAAGIGVLCGLLFGPLGVIIVCVMPAQPGRKRRRRYVRQPADHPYLPPGDASNQDSDPLDFLRNQ
jgi:hypothetical protein